MFGDLLEDQYEVNNQPPDDTHIVQVLLYYSEPESEEFKKLCKQRMRDVWPTQYIQKGNISDLLLNLLRHASIKSQETHVG